MIGLAGSHAHTDGGTELAYNVMVDGSDHYADGIMIEKRGYSLQNPSWATIIDGLSEGSHTFKLRWYGSGTTFRLYANSTFWVKEL